MLLKFNFKHTGKSMQQYIPTPISPGHSPGPFCFPSHVLSRAVNGSSLKWNRQMSHCNGLRKYDSKYVMAPPL